MRGGESEAEIRVAAVHRARIRTCRARGGAARNAGKPPPPPSTSRERESCYRLAPALTQRNAGQPSIPSTS